MEIQIGIDTSSFYHCLSPKQKRKIMEKLTVLSQFRPIKEDYENDSYEYISDYFAMQGVKLRISRIEGSVWGTVCYYSSYLGPWEGRSERTISGIKIKLSQDHQGCG